MSDNNDILHYGVKGMRWGVRNDVDTSGSFSQKQYQDAVKTAPSQQMPKNSVEHSKMMADKQSKFHDKFQPSPPTTTPSDTKGWRPTGTQVAAVGLGAAFVGLYFYGKHLDKQGTLPFDWPSPGQKIDPNKFMKTVRESWGNTPTCALTPESWAREEFTIPAGSLFHRISGAAEDKWDSGGTYMTHSVADFHRYIFGFAELEKGGATGQFHITSKATKDLKVPNVKTTLDALNTVMKKSWKDDYGLDQVPTPTDVIEQYAKISGGGWAKDSIGGSLMAELKRRGYSALVDEMDAGIIGETPLVVFDYDNLTSKASSLLTKADVLHAGENLTEILHRKKGT